MTYLALDALGDPTQRAVFERLGDAPRAVGDLAREFPVSRPAVSQHLKVLKEAGLVIDHQAGSRRIYQLDPDGIRALHAYFDQDSGNASGCHLHFELWTAPGWFAGGSAVNPLPQLRAWDGWS